MPERGISITSLGTFVPAKNSPSARGPSLLGKPFALPKSVCGRVGAGECLGPLCATSFAIRTTQKNAKPKRRTPNRNRKDKTSNTLFHQLRRLVVFCIYSIAQILTQ